jgi:pimeloyl-ACP methyl ester carboxylesterase
MFIKPRLHKFPSLGPHGFHQVAYAEWGSLNSRHVVVCAHGFARNSRDFDALAVSLTGCRVVAMDTVGRGSSEWLENMEDYGFSLYLSDAAALFARVTATPRDGSVSTFMRRILGITGAHQIDWIGTSMGGLLGMMLAAKPNSPIRRLVLNDIGPLIPWPALLRLKNVYAALHARFADINEVEQYLRNACATFGPLEDRQWRHVARYGSRRLEDGRYALAYDPGIVGALRDNKNTGIEFGNDFMFGVDLWPVWDAVKCPTLVLRGAESDFLLASTVRRMQERGPGAKVVEFSGIGHAPWLMSKDQIRVVRDFIREG